MPQVKAAALLILVLGLAGCGGNDDSPIAFGAFGPLSGDTGRGSFRFGVATAATQIEDQNPHAHRRAAPQLRRHRTDDARARLRPRPILQKSPRATAAPSRGWPAPPCCALPPPRAVPAPRAAA